MEWNGIEFGVPVKVEQIDYYLFSYAVTCRKQITHTRELVKR